MKKPQSLFCLLLLLGIGVGLFRPKQTQAHTVTNVGEFQVLAGWVLEPSIVGERNTLFIDFMRNNRTIQSADAAIKLELEANGQRRPVAASPLTTPDSLRYSIAFVPTTPGEFKVHIDGTLEGEPIVVSVAPELVNDANVIQFPDVVLSQADLQTGLISLESQLAAAQTRTNVALAIGVAGLAFGLGGFLLGRRGG